MGWIIKGATAGGQKDRLVIIQLTTMSLHVIPLVAITPCGNANGGNDEDLKYVRFSVEQSNFDRNRVSADGMDAREL